MLAPERVVTLKHKGPVNNAYQGEQTSFNAWTLSSYPPHVRVAF